RSIVRSPHCLRFGQPDGTVAPKVGEYSAGNLLIIVLPPFHMGEDMVQIIVGAFNPNAREQLADMYRQRAKIFVEEMGWPLKVYNGLEFDQYDDAETIYVLEYEGDELVASMRMNPTHRRCMLTELFDNACDSDVPRGPDVWELSRGALAKNLRKS